MTTSTNSPGTGVLSGRTVLVTGASGGIGRATALAAHREGAQVVAHWANNKRAALALAEQLGERGRLVRADFSVPYAAEALWDEAQAWHGHIDVLINNAGTWLGSPLDNDEAWRSGWDDNLTLNLTAPAVLSRKAVLHFRNRGAGTIIAVTSRSAHRGDDADHLAYGAAKAGLQALTKGIARGFASSGILTYCVAPGWVATDIAAAGAADATHLPLGEVTPPEDVAEMITFLASGRSRHSTGTTIDITGADYVR